MSVGHGLARRATRRKEFFMAYYPREGLPLAIYVNFSSRIDNSSAPAIIKAKYGFPDCPGKMGRWLSVWMTNQWA
jgi:hypothetical protein